MFYRNNWSHKVSHAYTLPPPPPPLFGKSNPAGNKPTLSAVSLLHFRLSHFRRRRTNNTSKLSLLQQFRRSQKTFKLYYRQIIACNGIRLFIHSRRGHAMVSSRARGRVCLQTLPHFPSAIIALCRSPVGSSASDVNEKLW